MKFECQMCGRCCRELPIEVFASDIRRWVQEERKDILQKISLVNNYPEEEKKGFYFYDTIQRSIFNDPTSPKKSCPFLDLEKNLCTIYDTRPRICRDYPMGINGYKSCPNLDHIPNEKKAEKIKKHQRNDYIATKLNEGIYFKHILDAWGELNG